VRHQDAVARPTFGVDIHALTAEHNKKAAIDNKGIKVKPMTFHCARSSQGMLTD